MFEIKLEEKKVRELLKFVKIEPALEEEKRLMK